MRLSLVIQIEVLRDERGLAYNVSDKGHWGNGPTEVTLNEDSDFAYIMGLARQAYEYQMGGERRRELADRRWHAAHGPAVPRFGPEDGLSRTRRTGSGRGTGCRPTRHQSLRGLSCDRAHV
jgi:hypothetical protein